MAILHLMVGLPCSGKTTYAARLAERESALLLTPDRWCIRLFGDDMIAPDHDRNHDNVEKIMWEVARRVLDFGFWAREERDFFRAQAKKIGADFRIHFMTASRGELFRRLEARNAAPDGSVFIIPKAEMEKYMAIFQPPTPDELFPDAQAIWAIYPGDALWESVRKYAEGCSWRAGKGLAEQMREAAFADWERVFAAFEGGEIAGYCTFLEKDCIPDIPYSPYIGYVFVGERHRGRRLSQRLIGAALEHARQLGFERVYLVSDHVGLYEKYGFAKVDEKPAPWDAGTMETIFEYILK